MAHEQRTFGWIQNPSSTENLKKVVSIFLQATSTQEKIIKHLQFLRKHDFLANDALYDTFTDALKQDRISYALLKGKGSGNGTRAEAKCSGLAQAVIIGQKTITYTENGSTYFIKKPYTDDWTADGFLRWAVSLGFLDYNYDDDTCSITDLGTRLLLTPDDEYEKEILGTAYLSYPPVCRILGILSDGGHYTKFELGRQLGFTDEAGFTSIPQNIWVQAYEQGTADEKKELRANVEGSSDKYARMICAWLANIGWVKKAPKQVTETLGGEQYTTTINSAFTITAEGLKNYKRAIGKSSLARVPKIVYREMLASKAANVEYLRTRRSYILKYIGGTTKHTMQQIIDQLQTKGFETNVATIKDDIKGFINIGLNIQEQADTFHLQDDIVKLVIPTQAVQTEIQSEQAIIKERVRAKLNHIDHKYLTLIDYSFQGKDCTEFEIFTIDLFTNELQFIGKHMGGTRKPDGIIAHNQRGVIIDNKAYSKGFTISRHMADEMIRYVQENTERSAERNSNKWWDNFSADVQLFSFLFISSLFRGNVSEALNGIKQATKTNGGAINTENLLYFADAIKGGSITKETFLDRINQNTEVIY
mgnify:CR=1 FL=1